MVALARPLYRGLFAAGPVADLFTDRAELAAMVRFEAALARAQAAEGVIPAAAGEALSDALEVIAADDEALGAIVGEIDEETARSGMPVPGLVEALGRRMPGDAVHLHFGATSQDVMDTGLALRLSAALDVTAARLYGVIDRLAALADRHRGDVVLARTRWQGAAPTSLGLKIAGWLDPLVRLSDDLPGVRARTLAVQLGGSVGNLAHMGGRGPAVMARLAADLGLAEAHPWHAARDRPAELASFLARLSGAGGKIATDLLLMAASEIREVRIAGGGGSSTLPHKQNPVGPEVAVALARHAATLAGEMHGTMLAAHERDGATWTEEWLALPEIAIAAHGALSLVDRALAAATFDTARMAAHVAAEGGIVHAEAATFALAVHMPRAEAKRLVKEAIAAGASGGSFELLPALAACTDAPVDWADLAAAGPALRAAGPMIDAVVSRARGGA